MTNIHLHRRLPIAIGAIIFTGLVSCKKDSVTVTDSSGSAISSDTVYGKVITVSNAVADTNATSSGSAETFYYSLEQNKVIPASQKQTDNWDIAFLGTYNSSISCNNGTAIYSLGYGGPGKGGFYMVKDYSIESQYYDSINHKPTSIPARTLFNQAFANLTTVPITDSEFTTNAYLPLDYFQSSTPGWAWYDFNGELFPNSPSDSVSHVAYAMPRPLIIRTAKANYAKLIIYSLYKGAPEIPTRSYKAGYLTFKYVLQKDGDKNLNVQ